MEGRPVQGAVTRYRVMAYVTGTLLIVLFFVAVPIKIFAHNGVLSTAVGLPHGVVCYPLYLLTTFDLYRRVRWPLGKVALIVLAGVIPFLTFYVERRVVAELRERAVAAPSADTAGV
jgi:integral membrane protein